MIKRLFREYKFLLIILIVVSFMMFLNLDGRILAGDELQTAIVAKNVIKFGVPTFYDGKNLVDYDFMNPELIWFINENIANFQHLNQEFNKLDYIWKWHPPIQFYITATSFLLFGFNGLAARLPFVIFGILSLVGFYFLAIEITNNKKIANLSIFLLTFYIPFYLYSRQCRYYSITTFFSILVIYSYLKFIHGKKNYLYLFIISNILLFYTFYLPFFAIYLAILTDFIIFRLKKKELVRFIFSSLVIAFFTLPWYIYSNISNKLHSLNLIHFIFGSFYSISYLVLYAFPLLFLILGVILFWKYKKQKRKSFLKSFSLIIFVILYSILINNLGLWDLPSLRYLVFIFPLFILIISKVIMEVREFNNYMAWLLVILLITTNFIFVIPLKPFEPMLLAFTQEDSNTYTFVKDNFRTRYMLFDYIYEITHRYISPSEKVISYLKENVKPSEIFLTNSFRSEIIYYLNITSYTPELNKSPDWIIPSKAYALWGNEEPYNLQINLINNNYEKIVINSTDYVYPLDTPHPRVHRFKENKELKTSSVYPYETYPIEIYHIKSD